MSDAPLGFSLQMYGLRKHLDQRARSLKFNVLATNECEYMSNTMDTLPSDLLIPIAEYVDNPKILGKMELMCKLCDFPKRIWKQTSKKYSQRSLSLVPLSTHDSWLNNLPNGSFMAHIIYPEREFCWFDSVER